MTGVPAKGTAQAVAYVQQTSCSPAVAAKRFHVSTRSVQRGLAVAGVARAPGRPSTSGHTRSYTFVVTGPADKRLQAFVDSMMDAAGTFPEVVMSVIPGNWLKTPSQAWATSKEGMLIAETVRHVHKRHHSGYPFKRKTRNQQDNATPIERASKHIAQVVKDPFSAPRNPLVKDPFAASQNIPSNATRKGGAS